MADGVNKEGQEPWSKPIMERMPELVTLDVPNGNAHEKGQGQAARCCQSGEYLKHWDGGNRTAE